MIATLSGGQQLDGTISLPGSKAYTHRALVAGLLSKGVTRIHGPSVCDDTKWTASGILTLGAKLSQSNSDLTVTSTGGKPSPSGEIIECAGSGVTLRFLLAVGASSDSQVTFHAQGELASRPLEPLMKALRMLGANVSVNESIFSVQGPLNGGTATLTGEVSSQFISALLFASPFAKNQVTIRILGRLESRPYVEMSLDILEQHGVIIEQTIEGFRVPAPQEYQSAEHQVPRDFSSAAFLMASVATAGGRATLSGLGTDNEKLEPDNVIVNLTRKIGLDVKETDRTIVVSKNDHDLNSFEFDGHDNPDLVPALEVLACYAANGKSKITGTKRLRFKESDRLTSIPIELEKMGARMTIGDDMVEINGGQKLHGARLSSHNDHRVVMACAAAALGAEGTTTIGGAEAVSKSYPQFFEDLSRIGARSNVE